MTIATTTTLNRYTGNGSTSIFPYTFRILAATDLVVTKRLASTLVESTLSYPTDYTVSGVGNASGGSITLTVTPATGDLIVIERVMPVTQPTSIRNNSSYFAETHENVFDRGTMVDQQQTTALGRTFSLSKTIDPTTLDMTLPVPVSGQVLTWSPTGLTNSTVSPSSVTLPGAGRTTTTLSQYLANNYVYNVTDYDAVGDGVADDGPAFQAAVNAAPDHAIIILPKPVSTWLLASDVVLNGRTGLTFASTGGDRVPIRLSGSGRIGFKFTGANSGHRFYQLKITGSGVSADSQGSIGTQVSPPSGTISTDITVENCEISNVCRGPYVDVSTVGDASQIRYLNNYIHDIVGTASGNGYGAVAVADDVKVVGNTFEKCGRHSTYLSLCTHFSVIGNHYKKHRNGVADGSPLPALEIARCNHGSVVGNTFDACEDLACSIEPSEDPSHNDSHTITVQGNVFANSTLADLYIGTLQNPIVKRLANVVVTGNVFRRPVGATNGGQAIRLRNGKQVRIQGNDFYCDNSYTIQYSPIFISADVAATETDHIVVKDNTAILSSAGGGTCSLIEVASGLCSGTAQILIGPNDVTLGGTGSGAHVFFDASVTNAAIAHAQPDLVRDLSYGTTVNVDLDVCKRGKLAVTNGTAFTVAAPLHRCRGRTIEYDVLNSSGGAMGAVTFDAAFKLAGAFVAPANTKRRLYRFYDDGTNMIEEYRSGADI